MENETSSYTTFASAWFALVFGPGDIAERLANALMRAVSLSNERLSQVQQPLFKKLGAGRLRGLDAKQMLELVRSLDEARMHDLAETIAQLNFVTAGPANSAR